MKKYISSILISVGLLVTTSCNKYLDINDNPNQATESTPRYVLPTALTATAGNIVGFHDYGGFTVGYLVNAGGFGGWGTSFTYNYSTTENNGFWNNTYDNLRNYQFILNTTEGDATQIYYNAIARIMKAYSFQILVDEYGDVPYSQALTGTGNLTPAYDKGDAIYQDLVVQLNKAIADINGADVATASLPGTADVMFGRSSSPMSQWVRFANTLKLRILLRASNSSLTSFVNTSLTSFNAAGGFLTDDAIVNPGYLVTAGKQNPMWNTYHSDAAGAQSNTGRSRIPSIYVMTFYGGSQSRLSDTKRGALTYRNFGTTPTNQLGVETGAPVAPVGAPAWYVGAGVYGVAGNTVGILKGPTMGQPVILAAESYFLLAEAAQKGFVLSGTAKANFDAGIRASFTYLEKNVSNVVEAGYNPTADATAYQTTENPASYLANYNLATTPAQQLEAIITQKYIALNFIHGHEAWNEFRRTTYPVTTGTDPHTTFVSNISQSTRADKLPVRIQYPSSEYTFNPTNAPTGINVFTSRVFWDAN